MNAYQDIYNSLSQLENLAIGHSQYGVIIAKDKTILHTICTCQDLTIEDIKAKLATSMEVPVQWYVIYGYMRNVLGLTTEPNMLIKDVLTTKDSEYFKAIEVQNHIQSGRDMAYVRKRIPVVQTLFGESFDTALSNLFIMEL